jgi:hypothetical protein
MEKRSFEVNLTGQYYGVHNESGVATIKNYVAKFVLPSQEAALSVIVKYLLDPYLRKNYPDYAKFRTHKITSIISNGRPPDPKVLQMAFEDMGPEDLSDFCILKHIFIDPAKHKDLEKCRAEIKATYEARIAQAKADQKSGASAEKQNEMDLLELNELPKPGAHPDININAQKLEAAAAKGKDVRVVDAAPTTDGDDLGL